MPLYPPWAAAAAATVCDEVFVFFMKLRRQPSLRVAPPYFDEPVYIEAIASTLETELQADAGPAHDVILASFHGMPKHYVRQGRSLLRSVCRDGAAAARAAQARREQAAPHLPVALRPRRGCSPTPTRR